MPLEALLSTRPSERHICPPFMTSVVPRDLSGAVVDRQLLGVGFLQLPPSPSADSACLARRKCNSQNISSIMKQLEQEQIVTQVLQSEGVAQVEAKALAAGVRLPCILKVILPSTRMAISCNVCVCVMFLHRTHQCPGCWTAQL